MEEDDIGERRCNEAEGGGYDGVIEDDDDRGQMMD